MKIAEKDVIQSSEKELIDTITGDLNWDAIEKIFKEKYNLGLQDDVEYQQGDIIVHNNQIAYKLDFEVKVRMSVLFDRKGDCLDVIANGEEMVGGGEEDLGSGENLDGIMDEDVNENVTAMANQIAAMISDINQDLT